MALYGLYGQPDLPPLIQFAEGLRKVGHDFRWRNHNAWSGETEPFHCVVTYGARAQALDLIRHYESKGVPVVVIDHGYMKRVNIREDYLSGHFQVGMGRLGWVPPAAHSDRFETLGVSVCERPERPLRNILILGQVGHDASHRKTPEQLMQGYASIGERLQSAGMKVRFRGHPLGPDVKPALPMDGVRLLSDAIADADAVLSLNSNAGLDALVAGCPAIVMLRSHYDEISYRWPVPLQLVKAPPAQQVKAYLHRLAYAQWTAAEMSEGLPQRFLASIGAIP